MKKLILYIAFILMGATLLSGAPARGGLRTYTQADGSTFQATLHGDAAFHWMESNGEVILYNPEEKNYYNAELNKAGKFVMSKNRVGTRVSQKSAIYTRQTATHKTLDSEKRAALQRLQSQAREGSHPR